MVSNQPWTGFHGDLLSAKALVYDPSGFVCSLPVPEPESAEYAACAFTLDDRSVRFRVAKTTPAKVGQFVTLWQRSEEGPIRPFDADDGVDLFVISSCDDDGFGQFVFPREVLCEHNIVSCNGSGGKRGFRVYPPWVTTTNRQARSTQAWQVNYFFNLGQDGLADLPLAHALYHP
ncbi:MepB family protein [Streptomyces sp. NPDC058086]|uniref:MepB family protein n=1 Tax=Streptomyces sp. NPDC058086 TaxID=3346334 RepID=UPI0036E0DD5B